MGRRIIKTGCSGKMANEILNALMGQMSDGIWENSASVARKWHFLDIDRDCNIIFNEIYMDTSYGYKVLNDMAGWDDAKIKKYLARKLKEAINIEYTDKNINPKGKFTLTNTDETIYLSYNEGICVGDVVMVYNELRK